MDSRRNTFSKNNYLCHRLGVIQCKAMKQRVKTSSAWFHEEAFLASRQMADWFSGTVGRHYRASGDDLISTRSFVIMASSLPLRPPVSSPFGRRPAATHQSDCASANGGVISEISKHVPLHTIAMFSHIHDRNISLDAIQGAARCLTVF